MSEPVPIVGGGEMGALIRAKTDWHRTPLGPPSTWPQSLRTALSIALSSRFPMVIFWGDDLCVLYNDGYAPILGEKHPAALGQACIEAWEEVWDVIAPMFERVRAGAATWSEDQLLALRRRGFLEETYLTWSYSPILDEAGRVGGVFTAVQETTARVLSERRLAVLRRLGEQVAQAKTVEGACAAQIATLAMNAHDVPFAAVYLAEGGRFRRAAAFGLGEDVAPLVDDGRGAWPLARALELGAPERVALTFGAFPGGPWPEPSREARVLPVAPYGVLVVGASPRLPFDEAYASFFELAAQQVASALANAVAHEEERQRARALAEIDRAKTAFFSNVSHEFRTPLTLMLAPIEEMRLAAAREPDEGARIELLHRNALRLLKLVNTLLDFSRIEAGRAEAVYEAVDLAALTTDLASSFRSAIESAGITLVVDGPPAPVVVPVDRAMWEKIVLNLLSNALKFTFEGRIAVRVRATEDDAFLEVEDTGIGIADEELPRVFERFHRIEGARARSHEGSGIGLALVHELVKMHGGAIDVSSRLGEGTTFRVRVPRTGARAAEELGARPNAGAAAVAYVQEATRWVEGASDASPAATPAEPLHRARIVIADDNADMREYLTRLLGERWDVSAVADGEAALEAIRRSPPDLVLADVMMPALDGFGLLRAVRSDPALRSLPFLLLSARAGEPAAAEGLAAGADDYIVKPFSARDLLVRVSTRLEAARVHEAERRRLLALLEQGPAIIKFLRGPDLVIELAHPKTFAALGGREILGKPLLEAIPEFRDQPYAARLRRVYDTGEPYSADEALVWLERDGERVKTYWSSAYLPMRDASGAIEGVMTFDLDVTATVEARHELERANRAKDEFLATVSHELRTPLGAILGWASILRKGARDDAKLERGLEVIERNAHAQARLVSDLLDVSRIVSGKLALAIAETDVAQVVLAAIDVVRPAADAKGVRLEAELDPALGAVLADADRLQQIVWNLLINAVRFTPRGGRIVVTAQRGEASIELRVRDSGAGIPKEHVRHIFERFRQVDSSTTRAHGGLGLGLAIVRHLVEAHGGAAFAESEGAGKGATFTVILPVRRPATGASSDRAAEGESRGYMRLDGVRVLLVDDDRDTLDVVREVLEAEGARIEGASSAHQALAVRAPYDVVVSDIAMPDMDGYALLDAVRAREERAGVPAIALTAHAHPADAERAMRAGFARYLTKPVDAEALVDAVRSCAGR